MKKIGEGWQYTVYDLGNDRVLKIFHSWLKCYWVILRTIFPFKNYSLWIIPSFVSSMKRKAIESMRILKDREIPSDILANPRFLDGLDFEQDKVRAIHQVFDGISLSDGKKIVDNFIIFNKKIINMGFIDKSFNITKNFGLSSKNEIVLIDIGELTDNQTKIRRQINNRIWSKHYVADCILNKELKSYFIEEMNKYFSYSIEPKI